MPPPPYRPRVVDGELSDLLEVVGAVLLEGPRAVGKTATALRRAASSVLFDVDAAAREVASLDPRLVLEGAPPRLLDEWQLEPSVFDHVRREVDRRRQPGQFILTGSAVPADDVTRHTGAGRVARLRMRPMSSFELGRSDGAMSLRTLFDGERPGAPDTGFDLRELVEALCVGGWPAFAEAPAEAALRAHTAYLDEVARADVRRVDGVRRDPARLTRVLRSLARNVATQASLRTIAADAGGADGPIAPDTVRDYLATLERLMVVEDQPAWEPALRSRSRLRIAATRHFADPCLAVAALGASPRSLLGDVHLLGFLFESLVVRDLRVYAQPLGGRVLHYRDNTGLELDAVVELADGRWGAFEVTLSPNQADAGAEALHRLARRVDDARGGPPAVLGVVVGGGYGYVRPDGVVVVPVGALGP